MSTETVSTDALAKSRKFHALALQRISIVGQNEIAKLIGTSDTTVSRAISSELERALQIVAAAGLKLVPSEMRCYPQDVIGAVFALAKNNLQRTESAEQLTFED